VSELTGLVGLGQQALLLALTLSLPVLAVALLASLLMGFVQSLTQVQDASLSHLPRLVAVGLVLAWAGPQMGSEIAALALRAFSGP
jgi:flagellar biosynthesis protein FliQ